MGTSVKASCSCGYQAAFPIGVAEPVSVNVETHGTGIVPDVEIAAAVRGIWDLTPAGIIRELDLLRPIYTATSALGHFGRWKSPELFRWERLDRSDLLLAQIRGR
jgi:S-adenosylmethionine synthetase